MRSKWEVRSADFLPSRCSRISPTTENVAACGTEVESNEVRYGFIHGHREAGAADLKITFINKTLGKCWEQRVNRYQMDVYVR